MEANKEIKEEVKDEEVISGEEVMTGDGEDITKAPEVEEKKEDIE